LKRILYINAITWNSTLEFSREPENLSASQDLARGGSSPSLTLKDSSLPNANPISPGTPAGMASLSNVIDPKKPSLFTAITSLLSSTHNTNAAAPQPLFLPPGVNDSVVVVYEDESASLISYTLSSLDYARQYESLWKGEDTEFSELGEDKLSLAKLLTCRKKGDIFNKFEYEKGAYKVKLSCTTYYAKQFHALRQFMCGEENFIQSLSRSKSWDARGGKSDATWAKTFDDRFILKEISKFEMESFIEVAPLYFEYLSNALFQQVPTILGKIFGVFKVRFKNGTKDVTQNLVVMENLFYDRASTISRIYDLKGSKRSRYVRNPIQNEVLLDENLLEVMFTSPIWVEENSKTMLQAAIWNDSLFLSSLGVMDYSLVVGVDSVNKQFIVGIIDYIRKYTWDKQLETWVKSSGLMGGRGKIPTVISPKQYKVRFREAMNLYFVRVPSKHTNFRLKY
jgi:1-phosphatidylinositol-3-phosphate 5-kinase